MAVNKVIYYGEVLVDMSQVSVKPEALVNGETALDSNGELITGQNPYEKEATDEEVATQADLLTQIAAALEGKASGGSEQPVLQSKEVAPSESEQTVRPDSGYNGLSQVRVGAISSTYVGSDVARKAAQIYTPGRDDQSIASGQYLSGVQTIKGDSNLISENIKSGVSIFGVDGSYQGLGGDSGGGSSTAELCTVTQTNSTTVTIRDILYTTVSGGAIAAGFGGLQASINCVKNTVIVFSMSSGREISITTTGGVEFVGTYLTNHVFLCRDAGSITLA